MKTRITEMLGIKYPIILAPMQWLSRAEMVAAASNAGGMGIIASLTFPTVEELRQEIKKTKNMTDKPFAVNVTLLPTMRQVNYEEYFNTAIEEGVSIVETAGRSPEPYIKLLKDAGVTVMHRATRIKDIKKAEQLGVDIVGIVGTEAAGHPGMEDVTSLVRIPIAADAVNIPVIAAGGIADARGFMAALALGAEGVIMGTRFMISQECPINQGVKEWLIQLNEADTMLILRSIKNAERVVKTDYSLQILDMERKGATLEELLPMVSGLRGKKAMEDGDVSGATITVGQSVGLVNDIPTIKEIIDGIVSEAKEINRRLQGVISG